MAFSKRIISLVVVAIMVTALAACGGNNAPPADGGSGTSGGGGGGGTTTTTNNAPADSGDAVGGTVSILTWTNPSAVAWLRGLAERLEAEAGITLEISDIDSNNHPATRQTRLMANDIDIVTFEGGFLRPNEPWNEAMRDEPAWQTFVEAGLFHDISDYPFVDNFIKDLVYDAYGHNGRLYGLMAGSIPLNGVFYNITRFEELGLSVPGVWDEFVALCEAIRAAGFQPITNGAGDGWPLNMFTGLIANNYYLDQAHEISKALFLGEKSFTDPDILPLYRMREQFASFMEPGVTGIPYSDVYGRFANETALMLADGSWAAGDVAAANPSFEWAYFPLPGPTPRADGLPHQMAAKYDFAMVVAENAPNRDGALAVLEFFSQPDEYVKFTNEVGFYPTQPNVNHTNDFLRTMDVYMQKPSQEFGAFVPKGVGEYGANGGANLFLLSVLGGPFTYEQLAAAAQEDWDDARAAFAAG